MKKAELIDYTEMLLAWPGAEFPLSEPELIKRGYNKKLLKFHRPYLWERRAVCEFLLKSGWPLETISKFASNLGLKLAPPYERKGRKK